MQRHVCRRAFSLIELLIVVGIIALLLMLLLPALQRAKVQARQAICASNLHQLANALVNYTTSNCEWIPGSPNTTGWRSFAYGSPAEPNEYEQLDMLPYEQRSQTHAYDWSGPLRAVMMRQTTKITDRQIENREGVFQCPALAMGEVYSEFTHGYQSLPSYLTCIYFLVSIPGGGTYKAFGYEAKNHFDYLPGFRPRIAMIGPPARKIFLADGTRLSTTAGGEPRYEHATNGFADYGAWRNRGTSVLQAYRDPRLVDMSYRHPCGINALFFDGHVESLSEPDSRQAVYWFPSGTDTAKLPNRVKANEPAMIVP